MNPAKRRRLHESTATLSKPFKSPMRVDVKNNPQPNAHAAQSTAFSTTTSIDQPPSSSSPKPSSSPGPPSLPKPTPHPQSSLSSPTRPTTARPRPGSTLTKSQDPEYIALQKQHSALQLQLSHLRTSLDTAQQAVKISTSTADAGLALLITKWKAAARDAAEDLFRGARDRVNKMGGVGAWRESMKSQSRGGWGDEAEGDERNEDGSELTVAQKEARAIMLADMQAELERYGGKEKEEVVGEERDDESFTMDMMLKQLNVELHVIGYDKEGQRWL